MMPTIINKQVPVPPPAYHRVQARLGPALHIDALTLVTTLHLLTLCHLAVRLAHRRCPPPLPAGPGGVPRTYSEESLLLISLLRTLWRLSYQDMHDWLQSWPALALACGLPLNKQGQFRKTKVSTGSQKLTSSPTLSNHDSKGRPLCATSLAAFLQAEKTSGCAKDDAEVQSRKNDRG